MTTSLDFIAKIDGKLKDKDTLVSKEWISERDTEFPCDIDLILRKKSTVERIQIIAHNLFIPKYIELFTLSDSKEDDLKQLGGVHFKTNKYSTTKHELKRIYMHDSCAVIKLRVYNSSINENSNKIGIIEVKIFGKYEANNDEHELFQLEASSFNAPFESTEIGKYSKEIENIMTTIENNKIRSVMEEDFQTAKSAQLTLRLLTKARKEMVELERDKNEAIEEEDYQRAYDLVEEMKVLRGNVLAAVDFRLVEEIGEDYSANDHIKYHHTNNLNKDEEIAYKHPSPKLLLTTDLSQTEKTNAVDTKYLIPPRPPSSRASTRYLRSSRERSSSMKKKSETQQVNRSPSSIGVRDELTSDLSLLNRRNSLDSISSKSSLELLRVSKNKPILDMSSTNKFMEKENMIVPAVLRGRSVSEINLKGLEQDQDENFLELEDEFLKRVHPNDKSNIKQGISIFSFKTMAKLYSKKWECRKDGISEIRSRLGDGTVPPTPDCMDCIIFILQQILRDSLHSVYSDALAFLKYICIDFVPRHQFQKYSSKLASATHDALALKAGDAINDRRSTTETLSTIIDVLQSDSKIARAYLIRFLEPSDGNGRRLKGRAKIIDVAATIFKLPDNEVALTDKSVTSFCTQCMGHSDLLVRDIGKKLLLDLYANGNRSVIRKNLLDRRSMQKNPLFRSLLRDLESIDTNEKAELIPDKISVVRFAPNDTTVN